MAKWAPYYPVGYPIRDGIHNPWVTVDPLSGATAYQVWLRLDRTSDESILRAKINELRGR
jgi:hypothetical protein